MIRKIILLTILATSFFFCQGQNSKINFHSIKDGLSNPYVKCIIKDSRGYLWFGTNEGLNKFDGSNFTLYERNINDPNSLVSNTINTILEDKDLNLWIGTGNGLCIYNRQLDNFKVFRNFGEERYPSISSLFEDDNNNIWIGTSGLGLYIYDKSIDSLYSYMPDVNDRTSISSSFINSIISDKKGGIWVGTRNGLDLFYAKDSVKARSNYNYKLPDELKVCYIRKLCIDKDGNLWVGTYGKGLYEVIDKDNGWHINHYQVSVEKGSLSNNDILSIICDSKGNLWIGTENGGLNVLPNNLTDFISYKTEDGNLQCISSNSIWSLYQDNTGIIWIGTYNHGVNFIDERIGEFDVYYRNAYEYKTLVNNNVVNFSEDQERNIWIATDGGGISSFNPATRSFTNKIDNTSISSKSVMDILCDSRQHIWAGTWGGGIELFNTSGKKIRNYRVEAYDKPGNIFSLMEDRNGNIWAGTAGNGLLLYNPEKDDFTKVLDDSKKNFLTAKSFVSVLFQDSENTIWIGLPNGLVSMKYVNGKKFFASYVHNEDIQSISSSSIVSILEDSRHNLWIGTNEGLNLFNKEKGTFTVYRKENGLPNNTINGILEDKNYCLWISTYGGISKFDIIKGTFKNYSTDDKLLSNSFNPRSSLKTRSGQFFMGCNNGFITFFPDSIRSNTYIPPVYLTDLKIFNTAAIIGAKGSPLSQSLSETKHITLNYKQTSFTIEFVALNFILSAKNQYAYRLEGFDEHWISAGTKQYATYTNIDAGKYIFKVKGANNEGIWNPDPVQLEITVLAPYWKTKWAYLFYFMCIAFILWGFFDLLIIKSNQSQKLRFEKIHHERSEELNRMKIQFFANISHEFRTPLSLIIAPLKQIIDHEPLKNEVKKRVEMVYRNANRMLGLINELMDFTKSEEGLLKMLVQKVDIVSFSREIHNMFIEEAQRRNINYSIESEFDSIDAWLDKSKMEKILSNLFSNAFKFTPDKGNIQLKISKEITKDQSFVAISLFDNGSGISKEYIDKVFDRFFQSPEEGIKNIAGTGIGLALVKSLVELHHGTINVTSQKWKETCFTVKIPLGNTHFSENEILDESDENILTQNQIYKGENNEEKIKLNRNAPLILIVEDNSQLLEYLASILARKYHTLKAADGAEGLKIARDAIPDLILSDISMPRLSGIELCKTIKNEMATSHIPVVLLTARTSTSDIIEGIGTGADAYITKPFDNLLLEVTIEKTIETRRKLYQRFSQDVYIIPTENTENELDRKFLKNIIDYIDKNASHNNITVETLASYLLMSRTSVYRKIKAITGHTATEFIRFTMLKMSLKLLEDGKYNISEIAFKVGFSSPGYFAKCFKNHYGKSPSDFIRKSNSKG
jgi:signal transduction histidine kinase/ligand-binding sensor domain-containing protein/DNA-binding response OmpR family regulator